MRSGTTKPTETVTVVVDSDDARVTATNGKRQAKYWTREFQLPAVMVASHGHKLLESMLTSKDGQLVLMAGKCPVIVGITATAGPDNPMRVLSSGQIAAHTSLSRATVTRAFNSGDLPKVRPLVRRVGATLGDVNDWLVSTQAAAHGVGELEKWKTGSGERFAATYGGAQPARTWTSREAWLPEQLVERMLERLAVGSFSIVCPGYHDMSETMDRQGILWAAIAITTALRYRAGTAGMIINLRRSRCEDCRA